MCGNGQSKNTKYQNTAKNLRTIYFVFDLDGECKFIKTKHFSDYSGWRRGVVVSGVRRMNEVNARRARLVPGWVTVFGRVYHLGMKQAN